MEKNGNGNSDIINTWISWRIICEVKKEKFRNAKRCMERLQITKQIDFWRLYQGGVRRRLRRGNIQITPQVVGEVEVKNGRIIFKDGYIMFVDQPLSDQIMGLTNSDWDPIGESESYFGEIVNVTAEVNLPNPSQALGRYPLFYYPQMEGKYLALSIITEDGSQKIDWKLFDEKEDNYLGGISLRNYSIHGLERWHEVQVRQVDLKLSSGEHEQRFDYLVNGMPLHKIILTPRNFNFMYDMTRTKVCFIGRTPDPNKPDEWVNLTGEMRRLVFDPNDSCPECRGP